MAVVTRRSAASAQVTPPSSQQDERKPAETTSASSTRRTSITSSSKITAPSKQETSSSPLPNPRLLAQAEALARMTLELNVRAVTAQADRLEESIKQLTIKTACDEEFRKQHEVRLQSLWQELVATREQVKNLEGHRTGIDSEVEKYRQEANCGIKVFRDEIEEMRGLVESVSSHLDQLPTAAEARAVLDAVHMRSELCEVGIREPMLHTGKWLLCLITPTQFIFRSISHAYTVVQMFLVCFQKMPLIHCYKLRMLPPASAVPNPRDHQVHAQMAP